MSPTGPGDQSRADVELRLPADSAYVSVLRTTTAGLAARLDFTLDDIEDLRIAVGEASALVLPEAEPGADLDVRVLHAARRADRPGRRPASATPHRARLRQLRLAGAHHAGHQGVGDDRRPPVHDHAVDACRPSRSPASDMTG